MHLEHFFEKAKSFFYFVGHGIPFTNKTWLCKYDYDSPQSPKDQENYNK